MNSKYKYLSQNILLFSISGLVPKALSFLMVPFYTSVLTPTDYGIADLISTTVMLLVPIFTLDIQDAVMRYALDKAFDNGDVISCASKTIAYGGILITLGAIIAHCLHISWLQDEYIVFVLITYFITAIGNSLGLFCRGINEVKAVAIASIITTLITIPANILFLAVFRWGITGYLAANVIGGIISNFYLAYKIHLCRFLHWKIPMNVRREMFAYSIPLIFNVLAWWINSVSDRYILSWISGVAMSGIFAVALKIPSILSVFQGIFYQAWSISAVKDFDPEDRDGFLSRTYTITNAAMVIICSGIMFFNMPLSWFLYSKDFFQAWEYVPLLLMSAVFNFMALIVGAIFTAVKDTKSISTTTILGAVVNLSATVILTYFFNAYGAASAMVLGYLAVFAARAVKVRRHIHLHLNWHRDVAGYVALTLQTIMASFGWWGMGIQLLPLMFILFLYRSEGKIVAKKVFSRFL